MLVTIIFFFSLSISEPFHKWFFFYSLKLDEFVEDSSKFDENSSPES